MKKPHIVVIVVFTVICFSWILFAAVRSLSSSFSVHKRISQQECAQIAQELALPLWPSAFLAERVPEYLDETSYASVSSLQKHLNAEKSSVIGYFLDFPRLVPPLIPKKSIFLPYPSASSQALLRLRRKRSGQNAPLPYTMSIQFHNMDCKSNTWRQEAFPMVSAL